MGSLSRIDNFSVIGTLFHKDVKDNRDIKDPKANAV